jgi:spore maturation protein CgeB
VKILYVAMRYDYGRPEQGLSFEHTNFYDSLAAEGHELVYFDFMELLGKLGRQEMNRRLLETARTEQADLMFTVLFTDELDPAVVRLISQETSTVTLNWFCDDHWRFESFSSGWAPCFDWVVTTAASAVPKYERLGYRNAIKSQWGCNVNLYRRLDEPLLYDVSFVGQPHGNRREIIEALRAEGISVHTWGRGWDEGRVSQDDLIRIFNQSKINLNLANASSGDPVPGLNRRLRSVAGRTIRALPYGSQAIEHARARGRSPLDWSSGWYADQIKGRNFEVPGCGGFLLTGRAEELERYYDPGREIAVFDGFADLLAQVRHFLGHEHERLAIAEAGYRRTLAEHTYRHRFESIFAPMGLPTRAASPPAVPRR